MSNSTLISLILKFRSGDDNAFLEIQKIFAEKIDYYAYRISRC
jgi:hypothetical protein